MSYGRDMSTVYFNKKLTVLQLFQQEHFVKWTWEVESLIHSKTIWKLNLN